MYDSPIAIEHSKSLRVFNAVGAFAGRLGFDLFGLDRDRILNQAAKATEFSFADDAMTEGLDRLIASLDADSGLNPFGAFALNRTLQRMAVSRFGVEKAIAERPELLEERITEPVFIIGMPRSGTSILQALLYRDAAHRSPLSWECLLPNPAPTPDDYRDNDRIDAIRTEFDQVFRLVPDFRKKHYMEADSPQECVGVTALNFTSFQYIATAYLPGYHEWFFDAADQLANLRWHKRFLKFLQSGGVRGTRWLLKSPVHLMRLKALFEVYPDARVIMPHRHPAKVVPSLTSLVSSMRSLYSDTESVERTGREQLRIWARYFDRFLETRRALNRESQIVDIRFDDFVNDQMSVVRRIYGRFGWRLDGASVARMQAFLDSERKDKHGRHDYSLEMFGLKTGDVEKHYSGYLDFLDGLDAAPELRIA